jgi:shikimate kinase
MRTDCALNIILIGMPGAGKSTVGVLLAKRLGYNFVDTDLLLQAEQQARLQEIIAKVGLDEFKSLEESVCCQLTTMRSVIATGGSVVYSERAMNHLRKMGQVVFIDTPLDILQERVKDMDSRGLVIGSGESYENLYNERQPLYKKYAEVSVKGAGKTVDAVAAEIETHVCSAVA